MSDEGEKTCPLCAEEMDLTDQQLKPCRCGYEICVWCWHHIMDMAEKDETEGRCPACRAPYNKEKIVGMTANCERLVAELSMERKKSQKTKSKASEGRKQLSTVRVIQRNLVYIVGLPLHLADEDLLQRKEYFGQYGKVLKVSMSRTAAGVIQQFPNNTCSVYITYSKDEEAVRCIQSVHGFTLEGRPLRACFGTTKYCHAWLRNVPCSNPDCLYLHEVGSQEDSFTKDEIISAFTRSRVQQITGSATNQQRRSGNVLPPPLDDYNSSGSTGKPIVKNASSNVTNHIRGSPPNGRTVGLPPAASWAARASNPQQSAATVACTNGPLKQKPDTVGGTMAFCSAVSSTAQAPNVHSDTAKKPPLNDESQSVQSKGKMEVLKSSKQYIGMDPQTTSTEKPSVLDGAHRTTGVSSRVLPSASRLTDQSTSLASNSSHSVELTGKSTGSDPEKEGSICVDSDTQNLCSEFSSISISKNMSEHSDCLRPDGSLNEHGSSEESEHEGLQESSAEKCRDPSTSQASGKVSSPSELHYSGDQCDWVSDSQNQVLSRCPAVEDDILSFDNQRLKDPEVVSHSSYAPNSADSFGMLNHSKSHSLQHSEVLGAVCTNRDPQFVGSKISDGLASHVLSGSVLSCGFSEKLVQRSPGPDSSTDRSLLLQSNWKDNYSGYQGDPVSRSSSVPLDNGESGIISRILSWDVDTMDESLTSPQNLARLLGKADEQPGTLPGISNSWRGNNNNQSRFSFARQEDSKSQPCDIEPPLSVFGQFSRNHLSSIDPSEICDSLMDKAAVSNYFQSHSFKEPDNYGSSSHFAISSNKLSAPPGFSVPSRAPPPGFTSHERVEQSYGITPGNHLLDASSLLRNTYQTPSGNISSSGDVELIDPAILAVGKGRVQSGPDNLGLDIRSNYPQHSQQLSARENEARLQLLMQRSLSQHQNLRYSGIGDNYSLVNDSYGIPSRHIDQPQLNNISPFAQLSLQQSRNSHVPNGHWDGWNEVQGGNNLGMAELLRNERLGFNKFYSNFDDSKFCMPSAGDLYNRTYGM